MSRGGITHLQHDAPRAAVGIDPRTTLHQRRRAALVAASGNTRPAKGHMPFPGRTMAEVIADEERTARRRDPKTTRSGNDKCGYCFRIGRCAYSYCPIRHGGE